MLEEDIVEVIPLGITDLIVIIVIDMLENVFDLCIT